MKKFRRIMILLLALAVLAVSCEDAPENEIPGTEIEPAPGPDTGTEKDPAPDTGKDPDTGTDTEIEVKVIDASAEGKQTVNVRADGKVKITNIDPSAMYAIRKDYGSPKAASLLLAADENAESVAKFTDQTYIPISKGKTELELDASSLGITEETPVVFSRVKQGATVPEMDLTVIADEDHLAYFTPEQYPVYEEYYHVNFKDIGLDPSNVAITMTGTGSGSGSQNWGYVTVDNGYVNPVPNSMGLFDFTGYEYINLYNSMVVEKMDSLYTSTIVLTNPPVLTLGEPLEITDRDGVYHVPQGEPGVEYVFEWKSITDFTEKADQLNFRTLSSKTCDVPLILERDDDAGTELLYIGEITEPRLFDLHVYQRNGVEIQGPYATVEIRPITDAEKADYAENHVIRIEEGTTTKKFKVNDKYTAFRFEGPEELLSDRLVTYKIMDSSGKPVTDRDFDMYFNNLHTSGQGTSNSGCMGSFGIAPIGTRDVMHNIKLTVWSSNRTDLTCEITVEPNTEQRPSIPTLVIMKGPENFEILKEYEIDYLEDPIAPKIVEGHRYIKSYQYGSQTFSPGDVLDYAGNTTVLYPVWQERPVTVLEMDKTSDINTLSYIKMPADTGEHKDYLVIKGLDFQQKDWTMPVYDATGKPVSFAIITGQGSNGETCYTIRTKQTEPVFLDLSSIGDAAQITLRHEYPEVPYSDMFALLEIPVEATPLSRTITPSDSANGRMLFSFGMSSLKNQSMSGFTLSGTYPYDSDTEMTMYAYTVDSNKALCIHEIKGIEGKIEFKVPDEETLSHFTLDIVNPVAGDAVITTDHEIKFSPHP